MIKLSSAALAAAALLAPVGALGKEKVNLVLNWVPTADHAPYYYAKAQGWYDEANIDLTIETGKGSGVSAQRVGAGTSELGISDLATSLLARGKGAKLVAVMAVYANSPQGFYWLKSSGIGGPKDFPGRKIGNPPGDASRIMWPAFAKQVGIDPGSVSFVNVSPQAKVPSLKSRAIDITSDFYNEHDLKVREFGDDLSFLAWRDIGINPYGNSIIVNADYLDKKRDVVKTFTQVSQKAFAACVQDVAPCLKALMASVSGLDEDNQRDQWNRIKELMRDPTTTSTALGAFDDQRVKNDFEMVKTYFGLEQPFEASTAYTNEFLDTSIKMTAK
ncbi:ABC transporter substrate-binding protein [Microvirga lotononidis]|uniref:ABC-type nitrate/sulfonate/bicarbonate transport system, periplasmic component n=1 Tax=Microvirga lotononidis TaxID=864069 RepID=I4YR63_9HYPH|nr:ABC transporter substrate-binding protein [Microvirga lotononidis]EIM26455.1 ABC-type nitrate/sulfonate/bicarbonate transport system, periplasmic component [Microvirga lotononidis]WQO30812.1 ABC transporter substrate-binding protein [Microvirga lotononidis]